MMKKTWCDYKRLYVPLIDEVLDRKDTVISCVVGSDDRALGWMAFARWPSIDVVHWMYVAAPFRRDGVANRLLEELRTRVAYTHRGPVRRREGSSDLWIAEKMRQRGTVVSYVPYKEWIR